MSNAEHVLVTIADDDEGFWYPRVFTPHELAVYLQGRQQYDPGERFRVWDIDSEGMPRECRYCSWWLATR